MYCPKRILAPCALAVLFLGLPACNLKSSLMGGKSSDGAEPPKSVEKPIPAGRFEVHVLTADWCPPCHQVPALLVKLRGEFPNVRFREFDVEIAGNAKLKNDYGTDGYPFFVLIDNAHNARMIDRKAGLPEFDTYAPHVKKKIADAIAGK